MAIYFLVMGLAMLVNTKRFMAIAKGYKANSPVYMFIGIFTLILGLLFVWFHNVWEGGALPVIVTIMAWLTLLKGAVIVLVPQVHELVVGWWKKPAMMYLAGVVALILGALLAYWSF